ncbi:alpha-1-antiproteinase-like [Huso huso]|uniref:Alpha-1-antiproteinase-like n=1 Tax=Huso huso TaxID=61971 RepID=A0ABR0Z988_HUSHU
MLCRTVTEIKRGIMNLFLITVLICAMAIQQTEGIRKNIKRDVESKFQMGSEVHPENRKAGLTEEIASLFTRFTFRLYNEIALQSSTDNIFFSPFSITAALALLSSGARSATQEELIDAFGLANRNESEVNKMHAHIGDLLKSLTKENSDFQLSTGNLLHIDKSLQVSQKFVNDTAHYYKAEVFPVDFSKPQQAKQTINDIIEKETKGKIKELFEEIDPSAKLILTNYIYFKGKWKYAFDPKHTRDWTFHVDETKSVDVPMMFRDDTEDFEMLYDTKCSTTVLQLPYTGKASMLLLLPEKGELAKLEKSLSPKKFKFWLNNLKMGSAEIHFPKLSMEKKYDVKRILRRMGIKSLFTNAANFSGISDEGNLKVSEVVHKAVLEVDESKTEAAAGTGIQVVFYSMPAQIIFNRPFILMIYEEHTGKVLFMGRVVDPTKK